MSNIKLTPQYIFALVLVASLLLGYLFYTMVIQPRQLEITTLNDEITMRETTLAADQAKARQVLSLTNEVAKLEVDRDKFLQALPATANFGQVVTNLKQTVSAAGGELKSLNFSNSQAANLPAGVRPIKMSLTVDGQFAQLFDILRNLEVQGRFTNVDTVNLQAGNGEQSSKLSSNMDLTVYTFDAAQATASSTPTPAADNAAPAAPAAPAPAPGGTQ